MFSLIVAYVLFVGSASFMILKVVYSLSEQAARDRHVAAALGGRLIIFGWEFWLDVIIFISTGTYLFG